MDVTITIISTNDPNVKVLCITGIDEHNFISSASAVQGISTFYKNEKYAVLEKESNYSWEGLFKRIIDILTILMSIKREEILLERKEMKIDALEEEYRDISTKMKQTRWMLLSYPDMNDSDRVKARDVLRELDTTLWNAVLDSIPA